MVDNITTPVKLLDTERSMSAANGNLERDGYKFVRLNAFFIIFVNVNRH